MRISNPTGLAICNYQRWTDGGSEFQHIVAWYRHQLALHKANRFRKAA